MYTPIDVFYATDRRSTSAPEPAEAFGPDRGQLTLGKCVVTIPKSHIEGAIDAPSLLRWEFSEDPAKHMILAALTPLEASQFYKEASAKISSGENNSALVFVHGYNVTFRDAALRTAQMSHDLKFKGAPVFFSWPSQGRYLGYVRDESNIEYAKSDLKKFLKDFVANTPAERIYLVAHSMGNRAVTAVLADLFRDAPELRAKFRDIILAAPDIDAEIFKRDIAPAIIGPQQNITLYASSNDWALKASKSFHGYQRAGDTGENLTIVPGLVTIDSSAAETGFLGHSYFAESKSIIDDILGIFAGRPKPEERPPLVPAETAAGRYWRIP
jgi:esterase/lipase superfamily enzyme